MIGKRSKILFLITEDWYFCSHRLPIACAARDAGYEVIVATHVQDHGIQIINEGLRLIPIRMRRGNRNPFRELQALIELIRIYQSEQPDLVHHVAMKPILYGTLAARLNKIPAAIIAFAGLGYLFISSQWQARMLRSILKPIFKWILNFPNSRIIIQNPDDIQLLCKAGIIREECIVSIRGSGVDMSTFKSSPELLGTPRVIMASRMLWDKGVGEFVEAALLLKKKDVQALFFLVGKTDPDNPSSISLEQIKAWEKEGAIQWLGHHEDMARILSGAHIVCLPSYREGLPKVLLEAAACGRPIVTTDVPGCREIVRHEENGLLVPPRNAQALAEALKELIANAQLRQAMGRRGRELAEKEFSVDRVVSETLDLYRRLIRP